MIRLLDILKESSAREKMKARVLKGSRGQGSGSGELNRIKNRLAGFLKGSSTEKVRFLRDLEGLAEECARDFFAQYNGDIPRTWKDDYEAGGTAYGSWGVFNFYEDWVLANDTELEDYGIDSLEFQVGDPGSRGFFNSLDEWLGAVFARVYMEMVGGRRL